MAQENPGLGYAHPGQWGLVAVAWLLVGLPLLWGIWITVDKALALFG